MDSIVKADIFFIVTTFAVIFVTLVIIVAAVFVIKILSDVKYISKKARQESDMLAEDIGDLRAHIKHRGFHVVDIAGFVKRMFSRRKIGSKK